MRLSIASLALLLAACGGGVSTPRTPNEQRNPGDAVVHLAVPFTLGVGHSASVSGTPLRLTFTAVTNDSRCAMGMMCIRAGDATVGLVASMGGRDTTLALKTPAATSPTTPDPATAIVDAYEISFSELTPKRDAQMAQQDYSAQFVVKAK